jgi:serine/threonine protein kinase
VTEAGRHPGDEQNLVEEIVDRFESAWQRGPRPNIDDYLPKDQASRSAVLPELALVELELRLKAGEPASVEDYLRRYLTLGTDRKVILRLIAAERHLRRRFKPGPTLEEYTARFPAFGKELLLLFQPSPGASPADEPYATSQPDYSFTLGPAPRGADAVPLAATIAGLPQRAGSVAPAIARPGLKLGGYTLLREIGSGGMGTVFEAIQEGLERHVAVKMLRDPAIMGDTGVRRFRREAAAIARLRHPNVIPVYSVGEQDGIHYYAMQLVEGVSLSKMIDSLRKGTLGDKDPFDPQSYPLPRDQRAPGERDTTSFHNSSSDDAVRASGPLSLPSDVALVPLSSESLPQAPAGSSVPAAPTKKSFVRAAVESIAQVADALYQVHLQGIIHRDVKPGNLFLAGPGRLLLMDFGLAYQEGRSTLTLAGDVVGTPLYMSPEQTTGGRVRVDHRTDIYSLGATLYELLTLTPPYESLNTYALLHEVLVKKPRSFRELNLSLPPELEAITFKAMAKNPDQRYQTAKEMADDLQRFLQEENVTRPNADRADSPGSTEHDTGVTPPEPRASVYSYRCSGCGATLRTNDPAPAGKLIKCPLCNTVAAPFQADVPAPSQTALPGQQTVTEVACIRCGVVLKGPAPLPVGQLVQCLSCNTVFAVPPPTAPADEPSPSSAAPEIEDLPPAEEEEDRPKKTKREQPASEVRGQKSGVRGRPKRRKDRKRADRFWTQVLVGLLLVMSIAFMITLLLLLRK